MKSFICVKCEKSFTRADSLKRHQKYSCEKTSISKESSEETTLKTLNPNKTTERATFKSPSPKEMLDHPTTSTPKEMTERSSFKSSSPKEMTKQPTFKIQFNPTWDEMILQVYNQLPFGLKAQKYLLEDYYFKKFEDYFQKVLKNRKNESVKVIGRFKYINRSNERKFETVEFNTKLNGENIKQEYLNKISQPILQKIREVEVEKDAIVLHMCFVKFFFKNLQPLEGQPNVQFVAINNKEYEMDEDCNLSLIGYKEEEIPGFRNM